MRDSPETNRSALRATINMPVYHWTEIRGLRTPANPDMMRKEGLIKTVNCRLSGQGNRGPSAMPAEVRLVKHDMGYCAYQLRTILDLFNREQVETLFEYYLAHYHSEGYLSRYPITGDGPN